MSILHVPLTRELDQALEKLARQEERTPAQQARLILRRALALPDSPPGELPTPSEEEVDRCAS